LQNVWLGKSYLDLFKAPLPRSIYPEKPPVDDGMYIRTIAEGYNVTPSRPVQELYASSWPPETLGSMYAIESPKSLSLVIILKLISFPKVCTKLLIDLIGPPPLNPGK
ncbi:hypothetical protein ACUOFC_34980, partial [Escherichia sp. TWPC-MK]